ncbi:DUF4278 domain-containing protein [Leptothermofonsia sp. ETS-13]|uniref:DUF4278 domain-containing protein n=1 Tax=Leptothermofonsia sp. ETS-13 TaxID=3035696 RepID=UPI003BA15E65
MELRYRGNRYQRNEFFMEGVEVWQEGIYRGTPHMLRGFHTSQPTATVELQYRGICYAR